VVSLEGPSESGPVIHVKTDLLPIGIGSDTAPHAAAKFHAKDFTFGRTQIAETTNAWMRVKTTPRGTRIEAHEDDVLAVLVLHRSPTLPVRKQVEFTAHEKSPGSKDRGNRSHENNTEKKQENQPGQAAQAA